MKLPKILSEKEKIEKEKSKKRWMTVFIVFVLMASTAAFAFTFSNPAEKIKYNGFDFIQTENGWNVKNSEIFATYLPNEVENISSPYVSREDFKNKVYFLAISSSEQRAANELNRAFYSLIEKVQLACPEKYANESFCSELPIKNCENETADFIVEIEESENQSIYHKNNCIKITGTEEDLIKSADKIIYSAYSIIK